MNRTVTVVTDKIVEIPGLGLFGPDPVEEIDPETEEIYLVPTYLVEPAVYSGEVTDEQITVWCAVNGRDWPEDGLTVGVVQETVNPQGNLFETHEEKDTFSEDN